MREDKIRVVNSCLFALVFSYSCVFFFSLLPLIGFPYLPLFSRVSSSLFFPEPLLSLGLSVPTARDGRDT